MRPIKILLKISAFAATLLLSVYAAIIIFMHTSGGQRIAVNYTKNILRSALSLDAEIGAIHTNFFTYIDMENLLLSGGNDTLAYLSKANISFSLLPILNNNLVFNKIEIDSLKASLKRDDNGSFSLNLLNQSVDNDDTASSPLSVLINNLLIKNSKLHYSDYTIPLDVVGHNVSANMSLEGQTFKIEANLKETSLNYLHRNFYIDSVNVDMAITSDNILIDSVSVIFPTFDIKGHLKLGLSEENLSLKGKIRASGILYNLLSNLSQGKNIPYLKRSEKVELSTIINGNTADLNFFTKIERIHAASVLTKNGEFRLKLKNNVIYLNDFSSSIFGGKLLGSASLSLNESLYYSLKFKLEDMESKTILNNFNSSIELNNFLLNAAIESKGQLSSGKIELNAEIIAKDHLFPKNDFEALIVINNDDLNLNIEHEKNSLASLAIRLTEGFKSGSFSSQIDSTAFFAHQLNLPQISGILSINGLFSEKDISAQISANLFNYQNMIIDTASVLLKYSDSTLFIEDAYLASRDSLIEPFKIEGLYSNISYKADLRGQIDDLHGKISLKATNSQYKSYHIDSLSAIIFYEKNHIIIDTLSISKEDKHISLSGDADITSKIVEAKLKLNNELNELNLYADFNKSSSLIKIEGSEIPIQEISPFIPDFPKWNGSMDIVLNAKIEPILKNSFARLKLAAEKLSYHNTTYIDSFFVKSEYRNNRLKIDSLKLYSRGEDASADFIIEFADSSQNMYKISHTEGHIEGKDIDLKIFNPFISSYSISGVSSNDIIWNGSYAKPNFDGFLSVKNGKIMDGNSVVLDKINIGLTVSDTLIKIDSIAFHNKAISTITKGRFDIDHHKVIIDLTTSIPDRDILRVNGFSTIDSIAVKASIYDFDLTILRPLIPQLQDFKGKLNSDISLNGEIVNPDIDGNLSIDRLKISHKSIDTEINNGAVSIRFKDNKVIVDTLNLEINKGYISAMGDITYDTLAVSKFNLKAELKNVDINEPTILNIKINNGNLAYRTKKGVHLLEGDFILGDSKIYRDLKIDDLWGALVAKTKSTYSGDDSNIDILSLYEEDIKESKIVVPDFIKNTKVNITFENRGDLWVDNNVADFFITFNLTLGGELLNPSLIGRINIKEDGKINFLDRVFDIKEGTFEFSDISKINPTVNISAETEITIQANDNKHDKTYTITLLLDGPMDQMTTSLTSRPSLDASDIISLLTLGMTYNEITSVSSSTESSDALKKRSGEIASQLISYKMNSYLKNILGDQGNGINFELKGDIFDMDDMRFAVNKRWGKKVTISYSTSMKDFDNRIIRIEYKISNQFSIQGETDQNQESAIDFKYRIRFK